MQMAQLVQIVGRTDKRPGRHDAQRRAVDEIARVLMFTKSESLEEVIASGNDGKARDNRHRRT